MQQPHVGFAMKLNRLTHSNLSFTLSIESVFMAASTLFSLLNLQAVVKQIQEAAEQTYSIRHCVWV